MIDAIRTFADFLPVLSCRHPPDEEIDLCHKLNFCGQRVLNPIYLQEWPLVTVDVIAAANLPSDIHGYFMRRLPGTASLASSSSHIPASSSDYLDAEIQSIRALLEVGGHALEETAALLQIYRFQLRRTGQDQWADRIFRKTFSKLRELAELSPIQWISDIISLKDEWVSIPKNDATLARWFGRIPDDYAVLFENEDWFDICIGASERRAALFREQLKAAEEAVIPHADGGSHIGNQITRSNLIKEAELGRWGRAGEWLRILQSNC